MTLIIICGSEIRKINTSLVIQCMQACARGRYKTTNTDFKRNNTPVVLSFSQRSSEGRIDPPTHPDQIRVGQNTAELLFSELQFNSFSLITIVSFSESTLFLYGFGPKIVIYSITLYSCSVENKVWEIMLLSGLSQAGTAWLRVALLEMRIGMNEFDHHILALLEQQRERPEKFSPERGFEP